MNKINKTYYWISLIVGFSVILILRYFGYLSDIRKEFFYTIFGLWICLILLPLFGEIEFLGIKLKKEISDLKRDVKDEIRSIRLDIGNSNNQQIILGYGPPPSDKKIPELEKEIDEINKKFVVKSKNNKLANSESHEVSDNEIVNGNYYVSDTILQLFKIRYNIENLITNIWNNYKYRYFVDYSSNAIVSTNRMIVDLKERELIDEEVLEIARGILSICNMAIHGKITSKRQRDFVFKHGKTIIDTLTSILNKTK